MIFFDPLYMAILAPAMLLSAWAAWATRSRFSKWGEVGTQRGMTGADTARWILDRNGLSDVAVEPSQGFLSDHYDPGARVVRLSPEVHQGRSISAVAVAAHETGHALQHQQSYAPLALRNAAVPLASFGSNFSFILILGGMLLGSLGLAKVGVVLFGSVVVFQLLTLPVEFDASRRAKEILLRSGLIVGDESRGVSKVLSAAAMTYVAAALTAILTLLYFLLRLGLLGGDE